MGNVILGLLLFGPQTIYSLSKLFEQGISLFYSASLGGIRGALAGLLDRGLIAFTGEVENGRSKKVYTLTDAGRGAFFEWLQGPVAGGDLETVALSKLYFLGELGSDVDRRAVLDDLIGAITRDESQLVELDAHLDAAASGVPAEYAAVFRYQRETLSYGLGAHRFGREFFERLRDELN